MIREFDSKYETATRNWIYGDIYVGSFLTSTVVTTTDARGSIVALAEAISIASGKPLLGGETSRARVWYINFYYCRDVIEEGICAALQHYGLTHDDLERNLFISDNEKSVEFMPYDFGNQHVEKMIEMSKSHCVEVIILDRFTPHYYSQGRTVRRVADDLAKIARKTKAAVHFFDYGLSYGDRSQNAVDASKIVRSIKSKGNVVRAAIKRSNLKPQPWAEHSYRILDVGLPNGEAAGVAELIK